MEIYLKAKGLSPAAVAWILGLAQALAIALTPSALEVWDAVYRYMTPIAEIDFVHIRNEALSAMGTAGAIYWRLHKAQAKQLIIEAAKIPPEYVEELQRLRAMTGQFPAATPVPLETIAAQTEEKK